MRKLWQTQVDLDAAVEAYTVGADPELDVRLLPYEIYGSLAHARGLLAIGILSRAEFNRVRKALEAVMTRSTAFRISRAQEDIHTAIEQELTRRLGTLGGKIHTGRSRNDQVQVNLRLYFKDSLLKLDGLAAKAADAWLDLAQKEQLTVLPGYTHLQRAMPTTFAHWACSHVQALLEGRRALSFAFSEVDECPLGSAAGYGVPLPLKRDLVSRLLGFAREQRNTLRVQSARPRLDGVVLSSLAAIARDLGTWSWDLSLYSTAEFGFIKLADDFTTGSSIMPQKKNPDVVELTRSRAALFPGWLCQVLMIGQLPSGYHRDYQLTKGPVFQAIDTLTQMLDMVGRLPASLRIDRARCAQAVTSDLLATTKALELVKRGVAFRDAYRLVAQEARQDVPKPVQVKILPSYAGAPANPDLKSLRAEHQTCSRKSVRLQSTLHKTWARLLK